MKLTIKLGLLSTTSIALSFLFQWYVLTKIGPGIDTDALFAGMTIPQMALLIVSGSLMHVLVPLLAGEDEESLLHDAWGFLVLVGVFFGVLAIVLFSTASWWIPIIVPGFSRPEIDLTVELTRIQIIGMTFAAVNGVQWATYHARQQFIWAEFTPVITVLSGLILLVWLLPIYGVIAAAWINTMRMVLQTILLAPGMKKPVWPNLKSTTVKEAWQRIKPLLLGNSYYKTDPIVDRFLLSSASSGSLSLYYLAQQIYGSVTQIINKAIAVPLTPLLSKMHKDGKKDGFRGAYHRKLMLATLIGVLCFLIMGLYGKDILGILIGYGNITPNEIDKLWWILIGLCGMLVGGISGQICATAFYAVGDTKTPTRMSIFTYSIYIPCKIAAFYFYNIVGLAVVTSIYYMANFIFQMYFFEKKFYYER